MPENRRHGWRLAEALIPALFAGLFITVYAVKSQGLSTVLTFGVSMAVAYILYLLTSYQRMPKVQRVLPLYLLAVGVHILHSLEELLTGFYIRFPVEIFHAPPFSVNEFVLSQTTVCALLIGTAVGIYKGWKIPMVMAWFLVVMLLTVNAVQHPIYALMTGGYFPGLFTSAAGWVLGPVLFLRLWEVRKENTPPGAP